MRTGLMTCDRTFRTFDRVLSTERQHVTTVATPVGRQIGVGAKSMWDSVVDLLLVSFLDMLADSLTAHGRKLTPSAVVLEIHLVTTLG
jgi:hypothetical protein